MPLDTILLLDTSGSMAGRGMRELLRACHVFLDGVEETARQTGLKVSYSYIEHAELPNYYTCRREKNRRRLRI